MDITDKVIGVILAFAVIAVGLPLAFGFLSDGNWSVTIGDQTFNSAPLMILLVVIVVLGIVYLVYKGLKGKN
jgi:hypothetical protein